MDLLSEPAILPKQTSFEPKRTPLARSGEARIRIYTLSSILLRLNRQDLHLGPVYFRRSLLLLFRTTLSSSGLWSWVASSFRYELPLHLCRVYTFLEKSSPSTSSLPLMNSMVLRSYPLGPQLEFFCLPEKFSARD